MATCGPLGAGGAARYNPGMQNGPLNAERYLAVRTSAIHGRGVYARRPIPAGTRIIEYRGERITVDEAEARYPDDFSG
ncbi:MAG: Proteins containing SET domain, partial [uncultured Gemmatimonadetes bacterium]